MLGAIGVESAQGELRATLAKIERWEQTGRDADFPAAAAPG